MESVPRCALWPEVAGRSDLSGDQGISLGAMGGAGVVGDVMWAKIGPSPADQRMRMELERLALGFGVGLSSVPQVASMAELSVQRTALLPFFHIHASFGPPHTASLFFILATSSLTASSYFPLLETEVATTGWATACYWLTEMLHGQSGHPVISCCLCSFTYTGDPDYGLSLLNVNGLAENSTQNTYWELLVKKPDNSIIRPDVVPILTDPIPRVSVWQLAPLASLARFTYTGDPDYGLSLLNVNGLAENSTQNTYWELLVKKPDNSIIRPDVADSVDYYYVSQGQVQDPETRHATLSTFRKWSYQSVYEYLNSFTHLIMNTDFVVLSIGGYIIRTKSEFPSTRQQIQQQKLKLKTSPRPPCTPLFRKPKAV
ncbi:hypothetical protein GBF38_019959 [Nibea albiflora]|uniref:Uncharacterized protein n=1 Tax=Nibea albiflora TaxID=240163 RepID=A0ACB7FE28_NIBAL|nr:hypothetical protein GBF38_019959 [Nibea albiflora]